MPKERHPARAVLQFSRALWPRDAAVPALARNSGVLPLLTLRCLACGWHGYLDGVDSAALLRAGATYSDKPHLKLEAVGTKCWMCDAALMPEAQVKALLAAAALGATVEQLEAMSVIPKQKAR